MNDTKSMIKNAFILFAITLVAGVLLGIVYQVTKDPIAYQDKLAQDKANQSVFASAQTFDDLDLDQAAADKVASAHSGVTIESVKEAKDASGASAGYVIQVKSKGYGDFIQYTVGITKEGNINGISIISIAETPGLGMNAEKVVAPQFVDKQATQFSVVKNGQLSDAGTQIEAISGATITSRAVTEGVNAAVEYFETALVKGGN
ncbi:MULTISPECIES: RnfABCDGE type electron transport complex subunit G [unclassified Butyrivibrio]|jgi:electron transport complex protein RnfG|uniref:RnfABCDGE type electron transport complex subunit G n=1 Tax=unclassified Butyrivibrio TaxID=2639466 RepID=UPI0003B7A8CA|nr:MULTISPECIES: RnfABCDGE type electron transport complex subunit G [unclassified Butyrivibrio]MDC7294461.1 RnfABCDGE type electron transport complex subunit G [Butyrivibrio sp. DSM 10294]